MISTRMRLAFLGLGLSLGLQHVALAADCNANFKSEPDTGSGAHFSTSSVVPGLDARNAIAQLKQIAVGDGFQIGNESYSGNTGQLTILQKQSDRARGFTINMTADQATKTISVETTLPPGMTAKPETIRGGMCGMLGRVDMSRNAAAGADVATAPAAPSADPFQGVSTFGVCTYNFRVALDGVVGRHYTTWVPVKNVNPNDAAERLIQIAKAAKLNPEPKEQHGTLTSVTVVQPLPAAPGEKATFPIRFMLEDALGVISVAARLNPKQEMDDEVLRKQICGMVAAMAGAPLNELKDPPKLTKQRKLESWHTGMDWLISRSVTAGKSLVVVPAVNLDKKYTGDESITKKWAFRTDMTATTIWQNKAEPRDVMRVGPDERFYEVGLGGFVSTFVAGNAQYFVFIVSPGTYTVAGNTYETTSESMSQLGTSQKPGSSPLGQITLLPKKNTDFVETQAWFDAQYRDREVTTTYCSSVYVYYGTCAFWATEKTTVSEMTEPAGWRNVTRAKSIDALAVSTKLKREFASFSVAPGEAIVIDGLYPTPPNADYNKEACEIVSGQIRCDLTRFTLTRIPANIADMRALASDPGFYPRSTPILANAKYRPLKLLGSPGALRSVWGQDYSISVR